MTDPTPEQVIKAASWAVPSGDLGAEFAEIVAALTAAGYSIVKLPSRDELATLLLGFLNPPLHDGSWTYNPTAAADAVLALLRGESP